MSIFASHQARRERRGASRLGRRHHRLLVGGAALVVVGGLTACEPTLQLVVDTAADGVDVTPGDGACATAGGTCSLRAAVQEANATAGFDRITIAPGIDPVLSIAGADEDQGTTGDLDVTSDIELRGQGATIDAAGLDRAFHVLAGRLRLSDVTVTGGALAPAGRGGAIRSDAVLEVQGSRVVGNTGGAIFSAGSSLQVRDSTIADNDAANLRGAIVVASGTATVVRSLVDDASQGLYAFGTAQVTLLDSTVRTDEDALTLASDSTGLVIRSTLQTWGSQWGNFLIDAFPATAVRVTGSVLDAPMADESHDACWAGATSEGYNVISDDSCGPAGPGDALDVDALLEPLADHGGPTATLRPHAGSAAVDRIPADTGLCGFVPVDQRGAPRPDGPGCDAGAVEGSGAPVAAIALTVDTAADGVDLAPGDGTCATTGGACSLRAAVMEANATNPHLPRLADTVTIAAGIDPTLARAGAGEDQGATGDLDITGALVLHGAGATLDGAGLDRVLDHASPSLVLDDLTVTGGSATGDGGGIRSTTGQIEITDATVQASAATGSGGGIDAYRLTGERLAVAGNTAGEDGGGIRATIADLTATDLAGNQAGGHGGGGAISQSATIRRSTIQGNTAATGGGLAETRLASGVRLTVESSTISGNHAGRAAAAFAPGLFGPGLVLTASTVAGNTGAPALVASAAVCTRGCTTWASTEARGSILVGAGTAPACDGPLGATSALNLAPDASCGASLPGTGALDPLAENGGPTPTHLPQPGSGAIDAVPLGTAQLCDGTMPVDQRGAARPNGSGCDVGAVER